ncbi:MAG: beta-ketoacyl-[acyl-carrier-protein] synthase family protein [Acidimicrobiales bacterium]
MTAAPASPAGPAVAVTGVGVLAPCGIGRDAFWSGLHRPAPDGTTRRRLADFDPAGWFDSQAVKRVDRFTQLAVAAAAEAVAHAGLDVDPAPSERTGVLVATGLGGLGAHEAALRTLDARGPRFVSPYAIAALMPNAPAATVSMRHGATGPCENVTTGCAAGTHAIGTAMRWIRWGLADVVLAGGTESSLTDTAIAGFTSMTALSKRGTSQPFDIDRDGFVVGEGAAVLVLERLDRACARGAPVLAIVAGAGSNADAHHLTAPAPDGAGAAACVRLALADAGLAPGDVTHVNAHGTATKLNDLAEARALHAVFGDDVPALMSVKGVTGHLLGAAGAVEAAAVVLAMGAGAIAPTGATTVPDPALGLDVVHGAPRSWTPGPALSTSFGFGGHNGCLVLTPAS